MSSNPSTTHRKKKKRKKNLHKKRAGEVAQCVGPEFKPQYHKKIKNSYFEFNLNIMSFFFVLPG
jgi:hypothetical protein